MKGIAINLHQSGFAKHALSWLARFASLSGLTDVAASSAHAQAILLQFISAVGVHGNVTYTFSIILNSDTRANPGSITTLYYFNGLLTGEANAPTFSGIGGASYAISTSLLGINLPPGTVALGGDDPTMPTVSLAYNGASVSCSGQSSVNQGFLTLHSTNLVNGAGDFTPFASSTFNISSQANSGNQGEVSGPGSAVSTAATKPEPGTIPSPKSQFSLKLAVSA